MLNCIHLFECSLTITADPLNSSVFTDDEPESSDDNCSDKDCR